MPESEEKYFWKIMFWVSVIVWIIGYFIKHDPVWYLVSCITLWISLVNYHRS